MTAFRILAAAAAMAVAITPAVEAAVPLMGVVSVSAGDGGEGMAPAIASHTCAITATGGVKCWGRNWYGQLGNGTTTNARVPVNVVGLTSGVTAVAAGRYHSCAIWNGGVKCWGANSDGQLGNGTTTGSSVPVDVIGLTSGVAAIATGGHYTCALTSAGSVKCWGNNWAGQLGNGKTTNASTPQDVIGLTSGATVIATGVFHACAITSSSGVKCWGWNDHGQLGNNTTTTALTPVEVLGLSTGVSAIAAGGGHTCALMSAGSVKCWGWNDHGQLGNGTTTDALTPADVTELPPRVVVISAGGHHTCILATGGGARCWGWNLVGQLGIGTTTDALTPVDVIGLSSGATMVAAGYGHSCATMTSGVVRCWGGNDEGQLGNGATTGALTPVEVRGLTSGVGVIAAGGYHTCALTIFGGVKCWGSNAYGELGDGSTTIALTPTDVAELRSGAVAIAAGRSHSCAVSMTGGAKCWGGNYRGQLGNGMTTNALVPVDVTGLTSGVAAIAAREEHTCALTVSGGVKCWGSNGDGQLGNGTTADALTPVDVTGLTSGVKAIAAGDFHSCALTISGGVKCWGANGYGQLGNGTTTGTSTPVDVSGLTSGVMLIAAGGHHTCALSTTGGMKCWGLNGYGQLGISGPPTSFVTTPTDVLGMSTGVDAITVGSLHTCAVTATGGAKCWGRNSTGQLGNGTTDDVSIPVNVTGLKSGVSTIAAAWGHTCALTSPLGAARCWGGGGAGQLGNGIAYFFPTPQDVIVGYTCADFTDVDPASPFCRSVEWLRNRAVTLGCTTPNDFCPIDAVSRLAMAAFMNRLGTALAHPVATKQETPGALDPDATPIVCTTADWVPTSFPRRVHADGVFAATAIGNVNVAVEPVASPDGGTTWYALSTQPVRVLIRGSHWSSLRVLGGLDADVGLTLRFGLRVSRDGAPGGGTLADSTCNLRLRIDNRNAALSPY